MKVVFRCDPALEAILPKPEPAKQGLPNWLKRMPMTAFSDFHGRDIRTVKQCPPFVDAMTAGFLIPLPCDVHCDRGKFDWDWNLPATSTPEQTRAPLNFHVAAQLVGSPLAQGDRPAIKFNSFWTIELEPGWSLLAMHPINRFDQPFRTLTGLVDADRFNEIGIFFPALWTDPDYVGMLPRGLPVVQCIPVRREAPELCFEPMDAERLARFAALSREVLEKPGVYKQKFRTKRGETT
ncbi:MAG TPA: hypothetical protein VGM59_10565 [Dongiaceae bacterium]